VRKTRRVEPASTAFAEVDGGLRSEASLAWAVAAYPFRDSVSPEGYQSRFSDSLNRAELEFVSLTNCEVSSLTDGTTRHQDFLMLSKRHVRLAYPVDGEAPAAPPEPPQT
jgi:hypothetical protein